MNFMNRQQVAKDRKVVGKSVPVLDAREKVTGSLKYGVDFTVLAATAAISSPTKRAVPTSTFPR